MKKISFDNHFGLKDRVIIITGAAGLLGKQHAKAIAAAGGVPIMLDINPELLDKLVLQIKNEYDIKAAGYTIDITNESSIIDNARSIIKDFGKIDALINNASNNPMVENVNGDNFSRLENFPIETWNSDIAVGLTGAFLCAKHYGTEISKNTNGGVIINISSDLGLIAPDQRLYRQPNLAEDQQPVKPVTYSVIKTGLIGLTRYLSTYWPARVRCNALCPGGVEANQPNDFIDKISKLIPLGRMATNNEYQGVLLFMLSDASLYLNGAVIPMDGGRSAW